MFVRSCQKGAAVRGIFVRGGGRRPDVLCKVKNKLFRQNSPAPSFEGAGLGYAIFFYGGGGLRSALAGGDSLGGLTPDFGIV